MTPTHDEINRYFASRLNIKESISSFPQYQPSIIFNCFTPEGISQDGLKVLRWAMEQAWYRVFIFYLYLGESGQRIADITSGVNDVLSGDILIKLHAWLKEREG